MEKYLALAEGPFLKPGPGPAGKNIKILGLWLLPLGLTWAPLWPAAGRGDYYGPAAVLTVLAGSLAGALAGAPPGRRRTAAADLDWLVTAVLGFCMLSPPLGGLPGLVFSLAGGLAGGLLAVRPGAARLLAAPGLSALALVPAAALAVEIGARLWPGLAAWPLELAWGRPSWPFVFAATAAGLAFHIKPRFKSKGHPGKFAFSKPFLWPPLAAGLLFLAGRAGLNVSWLPYFDLSRLAALTLPLALAIPALARTRRELAEAAFIGLVFLWLPLPSAGLFALDRALPPSAAALAAWAWLAWRRRPAFPPPPRPEPAQEETAARATLRCQALSPLAALWQGPASCRLAAAHDSGPRRCPYGCLGLGDCRAACPRGAIEREADGFPRPKPELCRGCGRCRAACPRHLWELAEPGGRVAIPCLSRADLKTGAEICPVGCLSCGRCRKACPAGAVAGRSGAPRVDRGLCLGFREDCGLACVAACPRGLVRAIEA